MNKKNNSLAPQKKKKHLILLSWFPDFFYLIMSSTDFTLIQIIKKEHTELLGFKIKIYWTYIKLETGPKKTKPLKLTSHRAS